MKALGKVQTKEETIGKELKEKKPSILELGTKNY